MILDVACQSSVARYHFAMTDDVNTDPNEDPDWESARTIWSAGGVNLPKLMNSKNSRYSADLKLVAAMVLAADTVDRTDRFRKSRPKNLANQCRSLSSALSQIDDPTLARMGVCGAAAVARYS